jgi:hypothetical protein
VTSRGSLSPAAEIVSYAGVLPFAACLLGMFALPTYEMRELAQRAAVGFGAAALAFVGAVHWGLALSGFLSWSPLRLAGSVAPAVVGAAAVLLGGQRGLGLLVAGFGVFWLYEHRVLGTALPEVYLRLRRNLSVAICLLLAITMILSETAGLR